MLSPPLYIFTRGGVFTVEITAVGAHSRADRAGVCAGDILVSINGHAINDVLDYRFYLADVSLDIELLRGGETVRAHIKKEEYDDIGLDFETPLMDKKHACENKCVFCFIDQLPRGMRRSLYFKDDDSRLSFLHGNYITLTNLHESDIDRIIDMHISPVNISVHTTNPELRIKMMRNARAGEVLSYLERLAKSECKMRCQIVLCRGINDGDELIRTMRDLAEYYPSLESVSVVPAGLTDHREGLYPLTVFDAKECGEVIDTVNSFGEKMLKENGTRLFFCADELYIKSGREIPDGEYYEDYTQIENGVGLIASMREDMTFCEDIIGDYVKEPHGKREISLLTGEASYRYIKGFVEKISALCYNVHCNVFSIKNDFFGKNITVSGLLTGRDIVAQLSGKPLGEELLFPAVALRADGDLFLDGMTPDDISKALEVPLRAVGNDGDEFISAILGIEGRE